MGLATPWLVRIAASLILTASVTGCISFMPSTPESREAAMRSRVASVKEKRQALRALRSRPSELQVTVTPTSPLSGVADTTSDVAGSVSASDVETPGQVEEPPSLEIAVAPTTSQPRASVKKSRTRNAGLRTISKKRQLSESEIAKLLRHAGFPEKHVPALVCTAKNESTFRPWVTNVNVSGSHDTGLFQINDLWKGECKMTRSDLLDPVKNVKCARIVYDQQGMSAWLGYTRKSECKTYQLAQAH